MKKMTAQKAKVCISIFLEGLAVFAILSILLLPLIPDFLISVWTHYLLIYFTAALAFSFAFAFFTCYYATAGEREEREDEQLYRSI